MDKGADRHERRRQQLSIIDIASSPTAQSPTCSTQPESPSQAASNQLCERAEKRQQRLSLLGMVSPSEDNAQREKRTKYLRTRRHSMENLEEGLMRDKSRRSALSGNIYRQQNRSDLSVPGAFRMTISGFIDDDPSIVSANTMETNTLYIPNASLVGDGRNTIPTTDYDFGRTVRAGVLISRSHDGMYMNIRQIRLMCLFIGMIVVALVSSLVVAVNKRANEEFPSNNYTSDNSSPFPRPLDWSDDEFSDPNYSDPIDDTINAEFTDEPTPSPSTLQKEIKTELASLSPSARMTDSPTAAPTKSPTPFPTTFSPTLIPTTEKPSSQSPTTLPSSYPSLGPTTARPSSPFPSLSPTTPPSSSPSQQPAAAKSSSTPPYSSPSLRPTNTKPASPFPSRSPT